MSNYMAWTYCDNGNMSNGYHNYVDVGQLGNTYTYVVKAAPFNGSYSPDSNAVTVSVNLAAPRLVISRQVDRVELTWNLDPDVTYRYQIYKATDNGAFALYDWVYPTTSKCQVLFVV